MLPSGGFISQGGREQDSLLYGTRDVFVLDDGILNIFTRSAYAPHDRHPLHLFVKKSANLNTPSLEH